MSKPWIVLSALAFTLATGQAMAQKKAAPAAAKKPAAAPKQAAPAKMAELSTQTQKASYAIGADIAKNLKTQGIPVDLAALSQGMGDVLNGKALALSDKEMQECFQNLQKEVQKKSETKTSAEGEKNLAAGKAFLAENAKKPGIKTLPSGLQYEIIKEGTGPKPSDTSTVTTHYHGTLIDGTVFDSSVERGQPASFPVNGVIKGWQEALVLMPVGSKWRLFVPADLAYGTRGAGPKIGPNATLIFEVELLSINGK